MSSVELQEVKIEKSAEKSHDTSTESETHSDALLKVHADGLLGLLEKIPLVVKLCAMSLVALVGMTILAGLLLGIAGRDLHVAREQYRFHELSRDVTQLITAFQDERDLVTEYVSNTTSQVAPVIKAMNDSDVVFNRVDRNTRSSLRLSTKMLEDKLEEILKMWDQLPGVRDKVIRRELDIAAAFYFYRDLIHAIIDFLGLDLAATGTAPAALNQMFFLRSYELQQQVRLVGLITYGQGTMVLEAYRVLNQMMNTRDYMLDIWYNNAKQSSRDLYNQETSSLWPAINQMEMNIAVDQPSFPATVGNYTLSEYHQNTTLLNKQMRKVLVHLDAVLVHDVRQTFRTNTALIVVSVVVVFLFFCFSLLASLVLSYTIIGPWRRLNAIQEQAISKFVPQAFLRIIGCYKITDVTLGKHVERNLTLLRLDVRDFIKITHGMTYDEVFNYLNTYLDYISPLIRRYGGFIDRYDGSVFLALFKHRKQASRACLDIQIETARFNKTYAGTYPPVNAGISVHSGSVLVGTVGESMRMQGTIISHHLGVSAMLERLARRINTGIMTTSLVKKLKYRTLGHVRVELPTGDTENVKVYELMHEQTGFSETGDQEADQFTEAVQLLEKGQFADALEQLGKCTTTMDALHLLYTKKLTELKVTCDRLVSELTIAQILRDRHLLDQFEQAAIKEYSQENILLWKAIESFRTLPSAEERKKVARKLQQDYLSLNGLYTININEVLKKSVSEKLDKPDSEISADLFDLIQLELEIVMGDTYKRFRDHTLNSRMIEKSKYAPPVPSLEDLM